MQLLDPENLETLFKNLERRPSSAEFKEKLFNSSPAEESDSLTNWQALSGIAAAFVLMGTIALAWVEFRTSDQPAAELASEPKPIEITITYFTKNEEESAINYVYKDGEKKEVISIGDRPYLVRNNLSTIASEILYEGESIQIWESQEEGSIIPIISY